MGVMLRNLTEKSFYNDSFILLKKPVYKVIKKINESNKRKIILTGPTGGGKTVVSKTLMKESLSNVKDLFVYKFFGTEPNSIKSLDDTFPGVLDCYFQLSLASILLKSLEKPNFNDANNIHFRELNTFFDKKTEDLFDVLNECWHKDPDLDILKKLVDFGKINFLDTTINDVKNRVSGVNNIFLIGDRFDTLDECSQMCFSKYFSLFDKALSLVSSENVYNDTLSQKALLKKGYEIINVEYGKLGKNLKKMIDARIDVYSEDQVKRIPQILNEKDCNQITDATKGNLTLSNNIIRSAYSRFNSGSYDNINYDIQKCLDQENQYKSSCVPKKLYL